MIVMLKMNAAEYGCKLQGFPTAPQVAKSQSDDVFWQHGLTAVYDRRNRLITI